MLLYIVSMLSITHFRVSIQGEVYLPKLFLFKTIVKQGVNCKTQLGQPFNVNYLKCYKKH